MAIAPSLHRFSLPTAVPTAATSFAARTERVALFATERYAMALVCGAVFYLLALCFLNAQVMRLPPSAIVVAEVLIAIAAVPYLLHRVHLAFVLVLLAVVVNFLFVGLLQQAVDPTTEGFEVKAVRDLALPIVFCWIGYSFANRERADRLVMGLALVAVALGLVEFILPKLYYTLFDSLAFYDSRGLYTKFSRTVLQVRPEGIGRNLFPFLGPRRISAMFLEPVALGNFAIVTAAWALSKDVVTNRRTLLLLALAAAMIVMADTRFGAMTIVLLVVARWLKLWKMSWLHATFPVLAIGVVIAVALAKGPIYTSDDIVGRLQTCGNNLMALPVSAWFGVPAWINLDAGYGYLIQRSGLPVALLLWTLYCLLPMADETAKRFRVNTSLYMSAIMCVSGSSLFALKTSAILWFLIGCVIAHHATFDRFARWSWPASRRATAAA